TLRLGAVRDGQRRVVALGLDLLGQRPVEHIEAGNLIENVQPPASSVVVHSEEAKWIDRITKVEALPDLVEGTDLFIADWPQLNVGEYLEAGPNLFAKVLMAV